MVHVWLLPVIALAAGGEPSSLVVEPARVTAQEPVMLSGRCLEPSRCRFAVELGVVETIGVADGELRGRWNVPLDGPPRRVAAALVDEEAGRVSFATVEVHRTARVDIQATPHAEVKLFLGDTLTSTGVADAKGRLSLRVLVPPGGRVARVEQKTNRKHPAAPRIDQLPVGDTLHLFAVALAREVEPGRDLELHALAYRDASDVTDARIEMKEARTATSLGAGRASFVVATTVQERLRAASREVHLVTHQGAHRAETQLTVPYAALPAVRVELTPEQLPVLAGTRLTLAVRGVDALGQTAREDARFAVLPPYETARLERRGGQLLVDVPGSLGERELRIEARLERGESSIAVLPLGPADGASLAVRSIETSEFHVRVADIYGNPTDRDAPVVRAEHGRVGDLTHLAEGVWRGSWTTDNPKRNREVARVVVSLPAANASETILVHRYRGWALESGVYGGAFIGRGDVRAFGGQLLVQARLPVLPPRLSLDAGAGLWLASRTQSEGGLRAERDLALAPFGLGASWEIPINEAWRIDLGALAGGLLVTSRVSVRQDGSEVVSPVGSARLVPQVSPWARLARAVGPGALGATVFGLVASDVEGLRRSPLGAGIAVGYAWDP